MPVFFFDEDRKSLHPSHKKVATWIHQVANQYDASVKTINYIFCSDDYLLKINRQYLDHDYYTDIITFDHSEEQDVLAGDLFISIDRVVENARVNSIASLDEQNRVMIHGLLHLLGFDDKSKADKKVMTQKEDLALSLLNDSST
ncbi:MAG: rRNA maturation RNase YbeY [Bacteroidota bacterium]